MTSSMPVARMFLCEFSPMTQRRASTRFDLPQPFGPTTPVSPGSIRNSVGSTKVLKPDDAQARELHRRAALGSGRLAGRGRPGGAGVTAIRRLRLPASA